MITAKTNLIQNVINELYQDSKSDYIKMMKGAAKSIFRPIQPKDFKDVYLSISYEQGEDLVDLITDNNYKSIVEFGTSFGISTLFLAQGAALTGGNIITTELIESKAKQAEENFEKAGVEHLIEIRTGDALETLKGFDKPIDLLLLDGWKDLYHPLFQMLEKNFHKKTLIYVDNADMNETASFLKKVNLNPKYKLTSKHGGKVYYITLGS